MTARFLDPRERQKYRLIRRHNELLDERKSKRKQFDRTAELDSVEDQLDSLDSADASVPCFRCDNLVNLTRPGRAHLGVVCLVEFNESGIDWQHYTPTTELKLERSEIGTVALLEPPLGGELALCAACKQHFIDYMQAQLANHSEA